MHTARTVARKCVQRYSEPVTEMAIYETCVHFAYIFRS
jgi:hypothetical protein